MIIGFRLIRLKRWFSDGLISLLNIKSVFTMNFVWFYLIPYLLNLSILISIEETLQLCRC